MSTCSLKDTILCVVGNEKCHRLRTRVAVRLSEAFRPKTKSCYQRFFRVFIAFCISVNVALCDLSPSLILCFLEYLMSNSVSVGMIINYVSALKAMAIVYNIPHQVFEHPRIKYFVKSIKMNRTFSVTKRNMMDIKTLKNVVVLCTGRPNAITFKAIFLTAFFGFFRLSNLVPHASSDFDPSKHFTGGDVFFGKSQAKMLLKWSKTLQNNDQVRVITLPRLKGQIICPYEALKQVFRLYVPSGNQPLFQYLTHQGYQVATDSKVSKTLADINLALNLPKFLYLPCFPTFRCHLGIPGSCPHKGYYGAGHLDVGLHVEVYPERCG